MAKKLDRAWGDHDAILRYVLDVLQSITTGRMAELPGIIPHFALAPDEKALLDRPYSMATHRAAGDGSYLRSGPMVFGTGYLGAGMVAGSLLGNAVVNSGRRARARDDATRRWRLDHAGHLYVTTHGFVFAHAGGLGRWDWNSVHGVTVEAPGVIRLQGDSVNGQVNWEIHSHAAELLFVLWAVARHPQHPQFADGSWLPPGWVEWAMAEGRLDQRPARPAADPWPPSISE